MLCVKPFVGDDEPSNERRLPDNGKKRVMLRNGRNYHDTTDDDAAKTRSSDEGRRTEQVELVVTFNLF